MKDIILASASPRRKILLEEAGLKFKIVESGIKEYLDPKSEPHALAEKLSLEKAKAVFINNKDSIIIAADTIIVCDKKILGKPKDENDAKKMLEFLSGKIHLIITGFTIIDGNNVITESEETKVEMKKINEKEIETYIRTGEPFGKAGAYAIQGIAKKFIKKVDGDLFNAIGLPVIALLKELKKLDV